MGNDQLARGVFQASKVAQTVSLRPAPQRTSNLSNLRDPLAIKHRAGIGFRAPIKTSTKKYLHILTRYSSLSYTVSRPGLGKSPARAHNSDRWVGRSL